MKFNPIEILFSFSKHGTKLLKNLQNNSSIDFYNQIQNTYEKCKNKFLNDRMYYYIDGFDFIFVEKFFNLCILVCLFENNKFFYDIDAMKDKNHLLRNINVNKNTNKSVCFDTCVEFIQEMIKNTNSSSNYFDIRYIDSIKHIEYHNNNNQIDIIFEFKNKYGYDMKKKNFTNHYHFKISTKTQEQKDNESDSKKKENNKKRLGINYDKYDYHVFPDSEFDENKQKNKIIILKFDGKYMHNVDKYILIEPVDNDDAKLYYVNDCIDVNAILFIKYKNCDFVIIDRCKKTYIKEYDKCKNLENFLYHENANGEIEKIDYYNNTRIQNCDNYPEFFKYFNIDINTIHDKYILMKDGEINEKTGNNYIKFYRIVEKIDNSIT